MDQELPLRDIHLPEPIGWWPLAPGWQLIILFILIAAFVWLWLRWRRKSIQAIALRELECIAQEKLDAKQKLQKLSILLRRVFISVYPREKVAGLSGDAWLEFLDNHMNDDRFSNGVGRLLHEAVYKPEIDADWPEFLALCRDCIDKLPKRSLFRGRFKPGIK